MKAIKDRSKITAEYCNKLEKWIKENSKKFFAKENEARSFCDFETWPDRPIDRNHLIMKGEVCIIDRKWEGRHAYVICQFYGNGRKVKDLYRVIFVDELKRSDWKNGYFLIPELLGE
ncbi:MAG: hypothetical protein AABY22_19500 [Nanoarchaeota archaeon]